MVYLLGQRMTPRQMVSAMRKKRKDFWQVDTNIVIKLCNEGIADARSQLPVLLNFYFLVYL